MSEIRTAVHPDGLHGITARREPVFHAVSHDGAHWLATLDIVKLWARQTLVNQTGFEPYFAELYVGMPNEPRLLRCELGITGSSKKPKLTITSDGILGVRAAGVLWTCDL